MSWPSLPSFDGISIALAVIGVVGVGGGIALMVFAPALLTAIVSQVERALAAMLSTRLGCALLAGLICFVIADQYRLHRDGEKCRGQIATIEAKAKTAVEKRDAQIRAELEQEYGPVFDRLKQDADALTKQVDEYAQQLAKGGADKCALGDGALRLRKPR